MKRDQIIIVAIGTIFALSCFLIGYFIVGYRSLIEFSQTSLGGQLLITAPKYINPLDGQSVRTEEEASVAVAGVMIDNHADAYPQAGLSKAKIVYEAMVEGGITRYFAIFDSSQDVAEVGPVRSARLYFLDWIQEYGDGLYVHSGGSPQALAAIGPRGIFDGNEFFRGQYFWRSNQYFAPHNLFTSSDNLRKMIDVYGDIDNLFTPYKAWKYSSMVGKTIGESGRVVIPFSVGYQVTWTYDAKNLNYLRNINGRTHKDKDKSEVRARNVIIQFTGVEAIINDDKGRQEIKTVGTGEAIMFKKGSVVYGIWKKDSITDRTRFYDQNEKEFVFAPGNTWVEVVDKDTQVEVTD